MTTQASNKRLLTVLEEGNRLEIAAYLGKFKEFNIIQFDRVLSISQSDRIPNLIKQDNGYFKIGGAITASIKSALEMMNLRSQVTEDQIVEIAAQVIEESKEDNLALEDVLLFLNNLITGKCGTIYSRMDIPTFFELFEVYRQERYVAFQKIKEEQHTQNKILGATERTCETNTLDVAMSNVMGRMRDLKEQLKRQRDADMF